MWLVRLVLVARRGELKVRMEDGARHESLSADAASRYNDRLRSRGCNVL